MQMNVIEDENKYLPFLQVCNLRHQIYLMTGISFFSRPSARLLADQKLNDVTFLFLCLKRKWQTVLTVHSLCVSLLYLLL